MEYIIRYKKRMQLKLNSFLINTQTDDGGIDMV